MKVLLDTSKVVAESDDFPKTELAEIDELTAKLTDLLEEQKRTQEAAEERRSSESGAEASEAVVLEEVGGGVGKGDEAGFEPSGISRRFVERGLEGRRGSESRGEASEAVVLEEVGEGVGKGDEAGVELSGISRPLMRETPEGKRSFPVADETFANLREELTTKAYFKNEKFQAFLGGEDKTLEAAFLQMSRFSFALKKHAPMEPVQEVSSLKRIPEHVLSIVDRILVEVPGTSHRQEVRIRLSQDLLPETEVRIFREGGRLEVHFVTKSQQALDQLSPHLHALKEVLERRGEELVYVSVDLTKGSDSGQNEGHSRQKRDVWEETREQDD